MNRGHNRMLRRFGYHVIVVQIVAEDPDLFFFAIGVSRSLTAPLEFRGLHLQYKAR